MLNIVGAAVATEPTLPRTSVDGYEYVIARNGVFIRAEKYGLSACIPVRMFEHPIDRLYPVEPFAQVDLAPRVELRYLYSIIADARKRMPNEAMYQLAQEFDFGYENPKWVCKVPRQTATRTRVDFVDDPNSIIDIHSHNSMGAFFSHQDNKDEQGFRFYCVLGKLDTDTPEIICRVGVFGFFMNVPMTTIFSNSVAAPIIDLYNHDNR